MNRKLFFFLCLLLVGASACQKDWLEAKRDLNTVLPKKLVDLKAILSSFSLDPMAYDYSGQVLLAADDYYIDAVKLASVDEISRAVYVWDPMPYPEDFDVPEWDASYTQVLYSNVVLETLPTIQRNKQNATEWDLVKGGALFFRAKSFYNLVGQFALPYDPATAASLPGIPLRLSSDPNIHSLRASVQASYEQILRDLREAVPLLTESSAKVILPSRPAVYGLLSRVCLAMRNYDAAGAYADSCLMIRPTLMDYNGIPTGSLSNSPFIADNAEVVFQASLTPLYIPPAASYGITDSVLYDQYTSYDLRRILFFNNTRGFRGDYTGSSYKFNGIATDEMYLTRAECRARAGDDQQALDDLNHLLQHRYQTNQFTPYGSMHSEALLMLILKERRKELIFRGLRWADLRRLNQEPGHETTMVRVLNGVRYELPPGDPRYAFPIPPLVIHSTGIPQNNR